MPLSCAVTAAEAAAQTVKLLWMQMTDAERDGWLDDARTSWPREDLFLAPILRCADECVANESAADGEDTT
jgi:hypothetical protein